MNYSEAIAYIQSFPDMERATFGARGPTMGLPSMRALLERMGNPQLGRKTIHVAGSKGKGSTSVMVSRILDQAGFKTALFTSPHLHDYCERIAFGGTPVTKDEFAAGIAEIKSAIEAEKASGNNTISTFGILTALFFHLAAKEERNVDWQIVEVGLGGRYDVTNVFNTKEVAIITPVSLEHVEILGSTQTEIATNKAGIITPECMAILAPQKDKGASTAVGRRCREVHANFIDVGRSYKTRILSQDINGQTFVVESEKGSKEYFIPLIGAHQVTNATTAIAAIDAISLQGSPISDEQIEKGLRELVIPGRMQVLTSSTSGAPAIVVDAAHNHESAQVLAETLKSAFGVKSCVFVIGLNSDKNVSAIWKELSGLSRICVATRSNNIRSMKPEEIIDVITLLGTRSEDVVACQSVSEAIEKAFEIAQEDEIICVTGSMYVVGEAREFVLKDKAWELVYSL